MVNNISSRPGMGNRKRRRVGQLVSNNCLRVVQAKLTVPEGGFMHLTSHIILKFRFLNCLLFITSAFVFFFLYLKL